jgi:hypothetical protein
MCDFPWYAGGSMVAEPPAFFVVLSSISKMTGNGNSECSGSDNSKDHFKKYRKFKYG